MPYDTEKTVSLKGLADRIAHDGSIPARKRSEWHSAIATFSRVCARSPSEIVADPQHLSYLMNRSSWQLAGLSEGSWANVKSRLRAMLQHAGIDVQRKRATKLAPEWNEALASLPQKKRIDLSGFAGWCTARAVYPTAVSQETFNEFRRYCMERTMRWDPKNYWAAARRAWNELVAVRSDQKLQSIANSSSGWRGIQWTNFPQSLRSEVEALKAWLSSDDIDDLMESDLELPGSRGRCHKRPLKPTTVKVYEYDLRAYASHLVQCGMQIEHLTDLAVLVSSDRVRQAFRHQIKRAELAKPEGKLCYRLFGQINAILAAARFLRLPEADRAVLGNVYRWVRPKNTGMSARKRELLSLFDDPHVLEKFLNLPIDVALELRNVEKLTIRHALEMQAAVALEIAIRWPVRRNNIANLRLGRDIMRPPAGLKGNWTFRVEAAEVKNEVDLYREMDDNSSALIEYYVEKFLPLLMKGAPSSYLFVTQQGKLKAPAQLSIQLKGLVRRRLGLPWHMHFIRSQAGHIVLEDNPGHYVDVKNILGHKNLNTTLNSYLGHEVKQSFKLYDEALGRQRGQSGLELRERLLPAPTPRRKRVAPS